ncbi:MAG: hypothetical protein V1876_02155, partial [Candidatus Peregrinibacteria bacterium]
MQHILSLQKNGWKVRSTTAGLRCLRRRGTFSHLRAVRFLHCAQVFAARLGLDLAGHHLRVELMEEGSRIFVHGLRGNVRYIKHRGVASDKAFRCATDLCKLLLCSTPMESSDLLTRAVETVVPRDLAEQKLKSGKPIRIYLGIDPTGAKLHIGHSVPLRKLKAFQESGHEVIFLIGSFTA